MKRTLIASTIAVMSLFSFSAGAATSVVFDAWGAWPQPDDPKPKFVHRTELIILQVTATSNGGETDDTLFGAIVYENSKVSNHAATNSEISLPGSGWINGALTCTTVRCVAFSYLNSIGPTAIGLANETIATQTYTVGAAVPDGTVIKFSWQTTPTGSRLDWFGITGTSQSAPGGVTLTVIPEPTTVALLGLGMLGLGLAGRRRRPSASDPSRTAPSTPGCPICARVQASLSE